MEKTRRKATSWIGRIAAVAALLLALAVVAWLFVFEDDGYKVQVRFQAATNVVKGNLVQVGGRRVGTIEDIELTEDGQADLTLEDRGREHRPAAHRARARRCASPPSPARPTATSTCASRPPAGSRSRRAASSTRATPPRPSRSTSSSRCSTTRRARACAASSAARRPSGATTRATLANDGWNYVNPALVSAHRLFRELDFDSQVLEEFVVNSSKLVTDVADRRDDLAALVDQLADTTGAIAREEGNLRTAHRRAAAVHAPREHDVRRAARRRSTSSSRWSRRPSR